MNMKKCEGKKVNGEKSDSVNMIKKRRFRLKSQQLIPLSFLVAIMIGTALLKLPIATVEGESTSLLTALFTAVTSLCVTGLVVVDTYAHWTLFGKIVILIMIQIGGLGIIAVTSALMLMFRKKVSIGQQLMILDSFNLNTLSGVMHFLVKVFTGTLLVEGMGAILYMFVFIPQFGTLRGIWYSCFTSVSAFCNAGIDIIGPNSLIEYNHNYPVMITTMLLIVLGGLGYVVWFDINSGIDRGMKCRYPVRTVFKRLGEHTKLVINLTLVLIGFGSICVFIMEYHNPLTIGNMSIGDKVLNSLFQSVTFRTAGFAAVPQQALKDETCMVGLFLMFIGGSPIGTAGGVKTVTMFVVLLNAVAFIRSRNESVVFGKKIPLDLIRKATAIVTVSFVTSFILMILLMMTGNVNLVDASYEIFSATATVGLSRNLTSTLNESGKIIVIIGMYLGRIGPISMGMFFSSGKEQKNKIRFAQGQYFVG